MGTQGGLMSSQNHERHESDGLQELGALSNDALWQSTLTANAARRRAIARLLMHLALIEERRLHLDPLFTWVDHHRCHSGESDGQVPPLPRVARWRTKRPECLQRWRSETSAKRTTEFDTAKTISVDEISDAPRSHFVALVRTVPAQHTCAHWARVRKQIALRAVPVCESVSRGR